MTPEQAVVLAVIPARGGSKGVPGKNIAAVGGIPLVTRAVRACRTARLVTDVVVSTDDPAIAREARAAGARVVERPPEISGDTASSEAALRHALDTYESERESERERERGAFGTCGPSVDVVLLVQCTSPFLTREDVEGVAAAVVEGGADTAHTVAPFHGFVWRERPYESEGEGEREELREGPGPREGLFNDDGPATGYGANHDRPATGYCANHHGPATGRGVNHDHSTRPRRQDRPQEFLETGAAYAMRASGFRAANHRFFGRTALVRTDPDRALEIDEPGDLERARALAPLLDPPGPLPDGDDIDAVVLDFDGTQTDDRVWVDQSGHESVAVHRGDGLGIAALRRAGKQVLILSTERNPVVAARARKLCVPVLHGVEHKDLALKKWCDEQGIDPQRVLYAGNDVNDLPCFHIVGWPVAVADARPEARAAARTTTTRRGGHGAIREIAGWLLGRELYK